MMTTQRMSTPRASRGFTLIELMIVVVVLGILGTIAYPGYQEYARKGRRAEARAALQELRQQQERYMTQFNTYKTFASSENAPFTKKAGSNPDKPSYLLSAEECGDGKSIKACVKLKATPQVADPKVGWISLDSQGKKACEKTTDMKVCWP